MVRPGSVDAAEVVVLARTGRFTTAQLGQRFGISHQRVSQLLGRAGLSIQELRNVRCANCGRLLRCAKQATQAVASPEPHAPHASHGSHAPRTEVEPPADPATRMPDHYCSRPACRKARQRRRAALVRAARDVSVPRAVCANCGKTLHVPARATPSFCSARPCESARQHWLYHHHPQLRAYYEAYRRGARGRGRGQAGRRRAREQAARVARGRDLGQEPADRRQPLVPPQPPAD